MELTEHIKRHKKRKTVTEIIKIIFGSFVLFVISNIFEMIIKKYKIDDSTSFLKFLINYNTDLFAISVLYLVFATISLLISKKLKKDRFFTDYFPISMLKMLSYFVAFALVTILICKMFLYVIQ